MAMSRFLVCLVVAWSCIALLAPPAQARIGLASGLAGSKRPVPATFFHVTEPKQRGSASSWSAVPGRGELRSVPAGPDPLHHHGSSPRRPEQEQRRVP